MYQRQLTFEIWGGGANNSCACLHTHMLGGSGGMFLQENLPGSLRHAARLNTSWPGQWLHYLAAVVSICEYTVSGLAMSLS